MTEEEFASRYGMSSQRCREIMEGVRQLVNRQVKEVIEHADFYIDPTSYCDEDDLKEWNGEDCLEKDEDDDGYPNLYEFGRQNSAESVFMDLISVHTRYGGHGSACEACSLMGIKWRD